MASISQWATAGRMANPAQTPISKTAFSSGTHFPYWQGNTLQIPGLSGLLKTASAPVPSTLGGFSGGNAGLPPGYAGGLGGVLSGGGGTSAPAPRPAPSPSPTPTQPPAGGGTAGGGGAGAFDAAAYFTANPALATKVQNLTPAEYQYIISQGYQGTPAGYAQFHYDTIGKNAGYSLAPPAGTPLNPLPQFYWVSGVGTGGGTGGAGVAGLGPLGGGNRITQ